MPLVWWLRASMTPIVIVALVAGLIWLDYVTSAPIGQQATVVHGTVAGFRLGGARRLRGEQWATIVIALRDGNQAEASAAVGAAATCHVGDAITVNRSTNRSGFAFLRAGNHPCG